MKSYCPAIVDASSRTIRSGQLTEAAELRLVGKFMMTRIFREVMAMGILTSLLAACAAPPPGDLGVRDGMLAPCPSSPNCVSSRADDARHRVAPLCFTDDPPAAFARLRKILKDRDDTTLVREEEHYLRAEFRTRLGFVDDGEFLLDPDGGCIHVRSASRLGYSDLGKNRSRMEEIRGWFAGSERTQ
ncbi:MAG TPA: DUF1499 domain-containing protein [Geobacteraceae bacterium]|nr:DUF1499 domain-containing protein [Geobacteraceae bacterium]